MVKQLDMQPRDTADTPHGHCTALPRTRLVPRPLQPRPGRLRNLPPAPLGGSKGPLLHEPPTPSSGLSRGLSKPSRGVRGNTGGWPAAPPRPGLNGGCSGLQATKDGCWVYCLLSRVSKGSFTPNPGKLNACPLTVGRGIAHTCTPPSKAWHNTLSPRPPPPPATLKATLHSEKGCKTRSRAHGVRFPRGLAAREAGRAPMGRAGRAGRGRSGAPGEQGLGAGGGQRLTSSWSPDHHHQMPSQPLEPSNSSSGPRFPQMYSGIRAPKVPRDGAGAPRPQPRGTPRLLASPAASRQSSPELAHAHTPQAPPAPPSGCRPPSRLGPHPKRLCPRGAQ